MSHTGSINKCLRGRGLDSLKKKNIFQENIIFATSIQEHNTICLLNPKICGKNDLIHQLPVHRVNGIVIINNTVLR